VVVSEVLLSWKMRTGAGNMQDVDTPLYILVPWTATIAICLVFYLYLRFKKGATSKLNGREQFCIKKNNL